MTQESMPTLPQEPAVPENLSVIGAAAMGWRLLWSDFRRLWLITTVATVLMGGMYMVAQCLGAVPLFGVCLGPPLFLGLAIFFWPPFDAGLFYVVRKRASGASVSFADVFAGFTRRYLHSLVAGLPVTGIWVGGGVITVIVGFFLYALGMVPEQGISSEMPVSETGVAVFGIIILLVILISLVLWLYFTFTQVAVWDGAESRGAAIRSSMRVVWRKFLSTVWATALFGVLGVASVFAATVPGALLVWGGCFHCGDVDLLHDGLMLWMLAGAGLTLVTCALVVPAFLLWFKASLVYLYCSWAGQPLMQPLPQVPPAPPEGALLPA